MIKYTKLTQALIKAKPAYKFTKDATYLITGGLGGLGRSISRWMVSRGARNLLLLGRSSPTSTAAQSFVEDMKDLGVTIKAPKCDVANLSALKEILEECSSTMPPIQGCIHGAMVLRVSVPFLSHSKFTNVNLGRRLPIHELHRLAELPITQSPRCLEPPHTSALRPSILHLPLLRLWHHRSRWSSQLRLSKHLS
jgi:hypothetical protein